MSERIKHMIAIILYRIGVKKKYSHNMGFWEYQLKKEDLRRGK